MSKQLNLEVFLIRKGGIPYDFVVRGKGGKGSGLSEKDCNYIVHAGNCHERLVKLLRDAQYYIRPLDPKYTEIQEALAEEKEDG